MKVPELETERLSLRGFRSEDIEEWAAICADAEVMRWVGRENGLEYGDAWRELSELAGHWELRGFGQWALVERDGGALVGRAGLHYPVDWPWPEVGWLVKRDRWGRGYATEAGAAAIGWGFENLELDHLISLIVEENVRSRRVAEKLGARPDGTVDLRGYKMTAFRIDRDSLAA